MDYFMISWYFAQNKKKNTMLKRKDGFTGERCIVLPKMIIEMEKQDPLVSSLFTLQISAIIV